MMRQQDGLGALQMGVPRQHRFDMTAGKVHQNSLQFDQIPGNGINGVSQVQAHIQCNLIITASGGMQFVRDFPNDLGQPGFNMGVNIFQCVAV